VEALRKEGKSWGQASGELGVHPGFLGIGKAPLYESRSVRKAKNDKAVKGKAPLSKEKPALKKSARAEKISKSPAPKPKAATAGKTKSKRKSKNASR